MSKPARFLASVVAVAFAVPALAGAPPKKTLEIVAKGKASYEINCASCHGEKGLGDGPAGEVLQPKPRNLVGAPFRQGTKPAEIFATLAKGIDGTTMVSFGHLPEEERWALAYYVLELRGTKSAKK